MATLTFAMSKLYSRCHLITRTHAVILSILAMSVSYNIDLVSKLAQSKTRSIVYKVTGRVTNMIISDSTASPSTLNSL